MINILVKVKNVMNKILSAASVVLLVFMTSLVLWQVFTRYVLGKPAAFTEELVKYSLMWTAFIGAAYAFFTRDHMSLTIIKDKLTGNKRKILLLVIDVLILLLAVFVFVIGGLSWQCQQGQSIQHFLVFQEHLYMRYPLFQVSL